MTHSRFAGPGSGLFYAGTAFEVRLGDQVRLRRWILRDLEGVVCYIPGLSQAHPEMEYENVRDWGIRLGDGSVLTIPYLPAQLQPPKRLELVARGPDPGLPSTERLG